MNDSARPLDEVIEAPAWRTRLALVMDLVAALAVLTLFVTPCVAVWGYEGPAASTLRTFGWVYLGVLIVLATAWTLKKKRQRRYVTIGMSIMDVRPLRVEGEVRLVRRLDAPEPRCGVPVRLASVAGGLLTVLAAGLLVYKVVVFL
ncbi:MAG: hypothetical protein JW990_03970 [Thermoleophilia bacterium]|nr:hypothetical protein [Thermoleophilia bacterium]